MGCLKKTDWIFFSCLISNFIWKVFKMLSRYFTKVWKKLVQKFATICIWKRSTFGFELELSLISKQNLKRKGLSWFQKCISKRSLPKWFERVEFIWFYLIPQKSYSKKNLNMCIKSFVGLQKKMGIENLLSSFLK